jgi:AcrR family transcriptional regulator
VTARGCLSGNASTDFTAANGVAGLAVLAGQFDRLTSRLLFSHTIRLTKSRTLSSTMSPRPYELGKRQEQIDESRQRVIDAARSLLAQADSYRSFTVEAVAKQADVAKATIYYQFGSKTGLLEALCDALAGAGGMSGMPAAFTDPDPAAGLRTLVGVFARFWGEDRGVMRRLRALAALDPDVEAVIASRDQRRRSALEAIVGRLLDDPEHSRSQDRERLVRDLYMLTSFETFDTLAGPDHPLDGATGEVLRLIDAALRQDPTSAPQNGAKIDD